MRRDMECQGDELGQGGQLLMGHTVEKLQSKHWGPEHSVRRGASAGWSGKWSVATETLQCWCCGWAKKVMSSNFSSKKNYIKSPYRENMYPVWTMDMDVVLYGREFVCPLNQEDVASGFLLWFGRMEGLSQSVYFGGYYERHDFVLKLVTGIAFLETST